MITIEYKYTTLVYITIEYIYNITIEYTNNITIEYIYNITIEYINNITIEYITIESIKPYSRPKPYLAPN